MRKIFRLLILIAIIFGGIGTSIGLFYYIGFLTYAEVEEFYTFHYSPELVAEPEKISIHTNGRTLNITHNTSSVPYIIRADVNLKVEGPYIRDFNYDFFHTDGHYFPSEVTTQLVVYSSPPTLGLFYHPTWTAKYDININITLRTDITYDLHLDVLNTDIFISENLNISELIIS